MGSTFIIELFHYQQARYVKRQPDPEMDVIGAKARGNQGDYGQNA